MKKIFLEQKRILIISMILLVLSMIIVPVSKAAENEKKEYIYKGGIKIIYKDEDAAKAKIGNIFKMKGILYKGQKVTIEAVNGNIIKIGSERFVKSTMDKFELVPEKVTGINISKTDLNMYFNLGNTYQLKAEVLPSNATNKNIIWTSSDESIATVDNTGKITTKKVGIVTITATTEDGNYSRSCEVKVTRLKMNKENSIIFLGYPAVPLRVISELDGTEKTVTWKSSNKNVAYVNDKGDVEPVSGGTATITGTTKNGIKLSCKVTVKESWLEVEPEEVDGDIYVNLRHLFYYEGSSTIPQLDMEKGEQVKLKAIVKPEGAKIEWESSNSKVVKVDKEGRITALKKGESATITVKLKKDGKKVLKCKINVK